MHHSARRCLGLEMAANYSIQVQGILQKGYFDRLGDMSITVSTREDQAPMTTLNGRVRDQAELMGILNSLYELHLPLLSVAIAAEADDRTGG
jgi:hypothetical protein